jgi:hypothetical protein
MGKLKSLWDEGHLGPFEHVALWSADFEPVNALTVAPDLAKGEDVAGYVGEGWRQLRHIGIAGLYEALADAKELAEYVA